MLRDAQRIAVIGSSGAGKSTLARQLGERLDLPVLHLDRFFWKPGWVEPDPDVWATIHGELIARDRWIIDGNYGRTMPQRLERADAIIYIEVPRTVAIARVIKRRIQYSRDSRPDMAEGCPEQVDLPFIRWIWDYPNRSRPNTIAMLEKIEADGRVVIRLGSQREVRDLLATL